MFFNPYFKVGALHNAGLAVLGPQLVGTNPTIQTIAELVGDYSSSITVPGGGVSPLTKAEHTIFGASVLSQLTKYRGAGQLVDEQIISTTQYALFMEILSFNRANSIDDYQVYFTQWEQKLNAYSMISESEKIPIYCMLSVGKDSAAYWLNELANIGTSDWAQWLVSPDHGKEVGIPWWQGDAAGAFIGAVIGSSVPGIGTCAGGVGGAITGSVSVLITNRWNRVE